jgi:dTDP-4-amino-4,6-dideoxygalactose transaminase
MLEVEHCVAVANGTLGLQLLAKAAGLTGEVVMPSFTFIGTAHAFAWIGLTPVFCDIDADTHTLDPAAVERAITPATSAIVGVHLWGRPCDVGALEEIAARHGLPLFFDAAHALGCSYGDRTVGGLGDAEVLSFHATKVANAAEGGAIATGDGELADRMRLMRNFGFSDYDRVAGLGVNAKMSELSAALGLASLDAFDGFVEVNRRNHERYVAELGDVGGVSVLPYEPGERHNFQYVVLELSDAVLERLPRDDLVAVLHAENVLARRYFSPGCHRQEPYRATEWSLPVTDDVSARVVVLPTGTAVGERDIATVCAIVRAAIVNGELVRERLRG